MICGALNVKDYGALGNGSHDDTDAFVAAMADAGVVYTESPCQHIRTTLCIPAGRYKLTGLLTIPYGLSVVGQPGGTVLDFSDLDDAGTAIQWGTAAEDYAHGVLAGFTMVGPGHTTTSTGIMAGDAGSGGNKVPFCSIRDCVVQQFGIGINLGSHCFGIRFDHLRMGYNGTGVSAAGTRTDWGENMLFDFCLFDTNDMHFNVDASTPGEGLVFRNCAFSAATALPEATIATGITLLFDKCTWYSNQTGGSGTALLLDIIAPVATIVFRDTFFALSEPHATPIYWDNDLLGDKSVLFDSCFVQGLGSEVYFYGCNSTYASSQPEALAIQSPTVTASNTISRIDP